MTSSSEQNVFKKKESRIPQFASREEEAEFWDTHDITDYLDEMRPVKLEVAKNLSKGITLRFDEETLQELRQLAHERGIGPTTLVRMWILERLHGSSSSRTQPW